MREFISDCRNQPVYTPALRVTQKSTARQAGRDTDQWKRIDECVTVIRVVFNKPHPCSTHQSTFARSRITSSRFTHWRVRSS